MGDAELSVTGEGQALPLMMTELPRAFAVKAEGTPIFLPEPLRAVKALPLTDAEGTPDASPTRME